METAEIRREINNAVEHELYAHGDKPHEKAKHKPHFSLLNFFSFLGENDKIGADADNENLSFGHAADQKIHQKIEQTFAKTNISELISAIDDNDADAFEAIHSNVIDSKIDQVDKHHDQPRPTSVHRESLTIVRITEDIRFSLGENVLAWKTISRKSNNNHAIIGHTKSAIVVTTEANGTYHLMKEHELNGTITCFDVFAHWNDHRKAMENIIVAAIENQLIFIELSDDFRKTEIVWRWAIHKHISTIKYFKTKDIDTLLLIIDVNTHQNLTSANVYHFDVETKHTWLFQMIPLQTVSRRADVLDTGPDLVLCLIETNSVLLLKLNEGAGDKGRYEELMRIPSPNVNTVVAFEMGGHSYIAIGGLRPEILRYHHGRFVAQTILSQTWGLVEEFVPVMMRTYRDDLVLLVQHRVHFETHSVSAVEALLWDGESFDTALSVPCHVDSEVFSHGMTCIMDVARDEGIHGTTVIQSNEDISLLVPRFKAPSGLFHLNVTLKSNLLLDGSLDIPNDVDELVKFAERQHATIAHIEETLKNSINSADAISEIQSLNAIKDVVASEFVVENRDDLEIGSIYFGDQEWTEEDEHIDLASLLVMLEESLVELEELERTEAEAVKIVTNSPANGKFRLENLRVLPKRSAENIQYFDNLHVDQLEAKFINDVPVDNLVFLHGNDLIVNGTLVFDQDLSVSKKVVVMEEPDPKHLHPPSVAAVSSNLETAKAIDVDTLHVNGNLNVHSINGIVWSDFVNKVVMTNLPNVLATLTVKGNVIVDDSITMRTLNKQPFPGGYLWTEGPRDSIISGRKNFTGTLKTGAVDCSGTVSDVNTFDVITLSQEQVIPGLTIFNQLEVSETLEVNGSVSGRHLDDFLANPSILQTKLIKAETIFQSLIIEGPVYIRDHCNGINLDTMLADVIYKSDASIICPSFKRFNSIDVAKLELSSNLINDIDVGRYLTTDTDQELRIDRIVGNVFVKNLFVDGLFDFINITELDENAIKLSGEQFTGVELIFDGKNGHLDVNNIEIMKTCNGHQLDDFVLIDEELHLDGNVIVDNIQVDELIVDGEVQGKTINGIDLTELDAVRLSRSKRHQIITGSYHVKTAIVQSNLYAEAINGYAAVRLQEMCNNIRDVRKYMAGENVRLENFIVNGSVMIAEVNGHNFDAIIDNAIWLNRPNIISGPILFEKAPIAQRNLVISHLNNIPFSLFVSNLILQNATAVTFTGTKSFTKPIHIGGDVVATQLNEIYTKNILSKCFDNRITGKLTVDGNVNVQHVTVSKNLNEIVFDDVTKAYGFDVDRQCHILKKNVNFGAVNVGDLQLMAGLNTVPNVERFIGDIIYKDHSGVIFGAKAFTNDVHLGADVFVQRHNEIDVEKFLSEIVFIDDHIEGSSNIVVKNVAFEGMVTAPTIKMGNILTGSIMGCSIEEWLRNALRTDLPATITETVVFPRGTFSASNINSVYLNGQSLADVFTLHTSQSFNGTLRFSEVFSYAENEVNGMVNGVDLRVERANTVMVSMSVCCLFVATLSSVFHLRAPIPSQYSVSTLRKEN